MEYVDGIDLHAKVKRDGPLPLRDAIDAVRQAALGLHFAHEEGFVHRDVKPANLILDKRGVIKRSDEIAPALEFFQHLPIIDVEAERL